MLTRPLSLPHQLLSGFDELKRDRCRNLRNSLNLKEFSVSTAPEVGRIIETLNSPSTLIFINLSHQSKKPMNAETGPLGPASDSILLKG